MNPSIPPSPPFARILVPLDGSPLAEAVLPAVAWIAVACHARLTLLHVIEHDPPETVHGQQHLSTVDAAGTYLRAVAARLVARGVAVDEHVHPNEEHAVARGIAQHARELGADLVALTTHGSGGLRGLLAGSIAQQVLRASEVPVLVVRPDEAASGTQGAILVALDGGPEAERALPIATMLAAASGAPLHLLRVTRTTRDERGPLAAAGRFSPAATAALLDIEEQEAHAYLAQLMARLPAGIETSSEVRRGDPSDEIIHTVREAGIGLLVTTTHAKAGLESIIAGSVIPHTLPRVSVPLLLIRIPARAKT